MLLLWIHLSYLPQVNQDVFHASCCAGSCALYRRETLAPLGGMAAVGHSEDLYTGFKVTELGYNVRIHSEETDASPSVVTAFHFMPKGELV